MHKEKHRSETAASNAAVRIFHCRRHFATCAPLKIRMQWPLCRPSLCRSTLTCLDLQGRLRSPGPHQLLLREVQPSRAAPVDVALDHILGLHCKQEGFRTTSRRLVAQLGQQLGRNEVPGGQKACGSTAACNGKKATSGAGARKLTGSGRGERPAAPAAANKGTVLLIKAVRHIGRGIAHRWQGQPPSPHSALPMQSPGPAPTLLVCKQMQSLDACHCSHARRKRRPACHSPK